MILLDTHILIWWANAGEKLTQEQLQLLEGQNNRLGVSIISFWEIAKLVEKKRLDLGTELEEWIDQVLSNPNLQLLNLTTKIVVESTRLPGSFHKDPVDQIVVATARVFDIPLLTVDEKIRNYPHVKIIA